MFLSEQYFLPFWLIGGLAAAIWADGQRRASRTGMKVVYVSTIERGGPRHAFAGSSLRASPRPGSTSTCSAPATRAAESFRRLGVRAEAVPVGHKLDARGGAGLWRKLAGADLVHTHDRRAGLFGRLAGRLRGARVLHTLHGMPEEIAARIGRPDAPDPPGVSRGRLAWLEHGYLPLEAALTRLGHVVTPSQAMADFLLAHGFSPRLLHVIPLGRRVRSGSRRRRSRRARRGRRREPRVLEGDRRPARGGAARRGAAAARDLRRRLAPRGRLERQAREAGVDARFHGFVADMRERLPELDVLVQPSRADNLPLSILEAMAAGLPVVGTQRRRDPGAGRRRRDGLRRRAGEPARPGGRPGAARRRPRPGSRARAQRRGTGRRALLARRFAARMVALYEELCASST